MFGFDMTAIAGQLKAFQDQSERLVNAVEKIELDIAQIKSALGIHNEGPGRGASTEQLLTLQQEDK